jgi:hypothetical protein
MAPAFVLGDNEGVKLVGALLLTGWVGSAQVSSLINVSNGVQLEITADFGKPTGQEQLTVEIARASGNSFYRIFSDQNKLAVFAYELTVNLSSGGNSLTATAGPVEKEFAARYPNADAGKPVPTLSSDHALGPLSSGESAFLGLFEIPGMGIKLTDTLRVKLNVNEGAGKSGSLRLAGVQVFRNGQKISGPAPPATVTGRFVMLYLPGHGGFFFALEPVVGFPFVNAGTIEGRRLRFTVENINFECTTTEPILAHSDGGAVNGQVWVYHDPAYVPEGNWTQDPHSPAPPGSEEFFTAAADSLGWWLR